MADENPRNDKITKRCEALGYCCPFAFFKENNTKRDTNKRLAKQVDLTVKAIEYNKKRLKDGLLICAQLPNCSKPEEVE